MRDVGLLILRVVPAAIMLFAHGWGKLMNFSTMAAQFPDPIGFGSATALTLTIFAEVFCALFLILGLATRLSAIPLFIAMIVAALVIHANDPWMKQEFPILYAVIFLTLIFTGGGKFGIGNLFSSKWLKS